jgi:hypothetical protein
MCARVSWVVERTDALRAKVVFAAAARSAAGRPTAGNRKNAKTPRKVCNADSDLIETFRWLQKR